MQWFSTSRSWSVNRLFHRIPWFSNLGMGRTLSFQEPFNKMIWFWKAALTFDYNPWVQYLRSLPIIIFLTTPQGTNASVAFLLQAMRKGKGKRRRRSKTPTISNQKFDLEKTNKTKINLKWFRKVKLIDQWLAPPLHRNNQGSIPYLCWQWGTWVGQWVFSRGKKRSRKV